MKSSYLNVELTVKSWMQLLYRVGVAMLREGGPSRSLSDLYEWLMWFMGPLGSIGRGDNYRGCHNVCDITTQLSI